MAELVQIVDMLDTIGANAANIPAGTKKVAIYLTGGGGIAWSNADVAKLQHDDPELQVVVRIDQSNSLLVLPVYLVKDIEPGASTIAVAIEEARKRAAAGLRTCLYTFEADMGAVRAAVAAAGLEARIDYWVADWNLTRAEAIARLQRDPTLKAIQWASPSSNPHTLVPGTGRTLAQANIDLSVTRADWPAAPAPPKPKPDPGPRGTFNFKGGLTDHGAWHVEGAVGDVVLGGPDEWQEAKLGVNRKHGTWRIGPLPLARKLAATELHPKVAAASLAGAAVAAVQVGLTAAGVKVHLTPAEVSLITATIAAGAGYLKK
ncbi:MAG: hypothetical protein ACXVHB_05865 [Solirubrobacteraceae bacterium]